MRTAALALALTLASAVACFGAEAPKYGRSALALTGPLLDLAADDMNGDGLKDIVAVSVKGDTPETAVRTVEVFHQDRSGGFPAKPDLSWRLDRAAAVFDTGDVTGTGRSCVAYIAPDGVYAYLPEGRGYSGRPTRVITARSVFTSSDPMDAPRLRFVWAGADGSSLVLVPGLDSLGVYRLKGRTFELVSTPGMPVETAFSGTRGPGADDTLTVSHRLPATAVAGYDRPGAPDIIMSWDDNALVYRAGRDGGYGKSPDARFRPGLLSKNADDRTEGARLHPVDINGDGRMDIAVTKKTGGIAHTKSLVFIYVRGQGGFPAKPTHTIITEGVVGPRFVDLDGDGRLDILLPSIKVGVSNFVNMLTSGKVNVDVDIYMQGKSGFPDRPTRTKQVGFRLDLSNLARIVPVMETGRFAKGGGNGLAVVSGDDRVSVYLPDRYSLLSDRPGVELMADAPTGMEIEDLNADGVDDFVLTYSGSDRPAGITVFVSDNRRGRQ